MNVYDFKIGNDEEEDRLNELISVEIFGWKFDKDWGRVVPDGHPKPPLWKQDPFEEKGILTMDSMTGIRYTGDYPCPKSYCTSIEDAWEIFYNIMQIDSRWSPQVDWDYNHKTGEGFWIASLFFYGDTSEEFRVYSAKAGTPALAICRVAFLPDGEGNFDLKENSDDKWKESGYGMD